MKTLPTTAIVALMTATLGLSAVAPALAQSAPAAQQQQNFRHHGPFQGARMGGGDILDFVRGAEAVEIALVRLGHRIELTAEQQPLFDAFKEAALAAVEDYTSAVAVLRPAEGDATRPGPAERLDNRIAATAAQLAALEAVQPAATAFFDSLTDEQLAQLFPQRPDRADRTSRPGFFGGPGAHRPGGPAAPSAPAPEAPANG